MKSSRGHYPELMDRIHILISNLDDHILHHPLTQESENLKDLIDTAHSNLIDAYNLISVMEIYDNELKKSKK
jgi:hypothetical protein